MLTKVAIKVQVKDYPTGSVVRLHFWLDDFYLRKDIEKYIKTKLKFDKEFTDKYIIHDTIIDKIVYVNSKSVKEEFGSLIFDSCKRISLNFTSSSATSPKSTATTSTTSTTFKSKKKKDEKKKISFVDMEMDKLLEHKEKIDAELFRREHSFTEEEYLFYKTNMDVLSVDNVKTMFKTCNGDIYKLKKDRIRQRLGILN